MDSPLLSAPLPPLLHLGTSSFTAEGWEKSFYPPGMPKRDYLSFYATRFNTLEIDATFYAIPAVSTVKGWAAKTPPHFRFALKAPQDITHERLENDTVPILTEFLRATEPLGEKLAVILLQFPYFNRQVFPSPNEFLARLKPLLASLPPLRPRNPQQALAHSAVSRLAAAAQRRSHLD